MLIPRFTIKIMLIVTTVAAVISYVMAQALKGGFAGIFLSERFAGRRMGPGNVQGSEFAQSAGEPWAAALIFALGGIGLIFVLFILFWAAAWILEQTFGHLLRSPAPAGGNPFASAGPPRQVVPPTDPQ
ncbi:hypothetical protein ETAA8_07840 [Anatilimnocola aggregata]|uniref:Uncharacterized protein n=1 Tax=Anatilimnocola aggregata TaxID=2528021 RepID=A0A517Y651_9BACT|nr:hypothetical protein [Anatilimnocola aggregata]QDU25714.1 hypothetical protein ETAA8_07840 [Anatilimnocola aggregata]